MTAFTDEHRKTLVALIEQRSKLFPSGIDRGWIEADEGDAAQAALAEIDRLREWQHKARELLQLHGSDEHCRHLGTPAVAVTVFMDPAAGFYGLCAACAADWPDAVWLVDRP